jgi:hypothetical protein
VGTAKTADIYHGSSKPPGLCKPPRCPGGLRKTGRVKAVKTVDIYHVSSKPPGSCTPPGELRKIAWGLFLQSKEVNRRPAAVLQLAMNSPALTRPGGARCAVEPSPALLYPRQHVVFLES